MEVVKLVVHAVEDPSDESWDRDITVVIAECCKVGLIGNDGEVSPSDFDFVCIGDPDWRSHVTCPACLDPENGLTALSDELEEVR